MPQSNKAEVIGRVCAALVEESRATAAGIARAEYPWSPRFVAKRGYSKTSALRIFIRDGFIDRYFGSQLVFPGTLLILAQVMPNEFPSNATWKVSKSHEVFWELWPAIDHLVPMARGGSNGDSNLFSTSTLHNNAKSHWLPEELGWTLHPAGDIKKWDGLLHWFNGYVQRHPELLAIRQIKDWHKAAKANVFA